MALFRNRGGRTASGSKHIRGRYPVEYKSWLWWEVGLPLASPAMIFLLLLLALIGKHADASPVKALISISGSGDLLIFAALMLINIGAKLRVLEVPRRRKQDFEAGDFDPDAPFFLAIFF